MEGIEEQLADNPKFIFYISRGEETLDEDNNIVTGNYSIEKMMVSEND